MTAEPAEGFAPMVYLAVLYRWKWLVIGVALLAGAVGVAQLQRNVSLYQATARLVYAQPVIASNPLVQGGVPEALRQPTNGTVSAVFASSQLAGAAAAALRGKDTSAGYNVSVPLPPGGRGLSPEDWQANVVVIEGVSSNPQTAADAVNAYAEAFVAYRRDSGRTQVGNALLAVQGALQSNAMVVSEESLAYLQLKQAEQALQLQLQTVGSDFSLAAPAVPPLAPFEPRRMHTLLKHVILGLGLGIVIAFLLEGLDTRVRDEQELRHLLDMTVLGHLPRLSRPTGDDGTTPQMLVDPSGPMAEAVRALRVNLDFTNVDGDVKSVLVTSSIRGEGKSVTASNLAVSMALAGQRVVLVDADFRRPRIHTYMRVSNVVGLSSVLARRAELLDALTAIVLEGHESAERASRVPLLRVLPSGPLPPNPGEMAASQRLGEIVDSLADAADWVIIDAPPLLEVGDAIPMAASVDGVIFIGNMRRLRWPMLERSRVQLERFRCRKLGLIVVAGKGAHKHVYGRRYDLSTSPRSADR